MWSPDFYEKILKHIRNIAKCNACHQISIKVILTHGIDVGKFDRSIPSWDTCDARQNSTIILSLAGLQKFIMCLDT